MKLAEKKLVLVAAWMTIVMGGWSLAQRVAWADEPKCSCKATAEFRVAEVPLLSRLPHLGQLFFYPSIWEKSSCASEGHSSEAFERIGIDFDFALIPHNWLCTRDGLFACCVGCDESACPAENANFYLTVTTDGLVGLDEENKLGLDLSDDEQNCSSGKCAKSGEKVAPCCAASPGGQGAQCCAVAKQAEVAQSCAASAAEQVAQCCALLNGQVARCCGEAGSSPGAECVAELPIAVKSEQVETLAALPLHCHRRFVELAVENASLKAHSEAMQEILEAHTEMLERHAMFAEEKAKLEARLEMMEALVAEREKHFKAVHELASENQRLKSELESLARHQSQQEQTIELTLDNERLKARLAELEATEKVPAEGRVAKKARAARKVR